MAPSRTFVWGGDTYKQGTLPGQKPCNQETQGQRDSAKAGIIGSSYSRPVGGLAPGGGGGTPPPGKGGPPGDRICDRLKALKGALFHSTLLTYLQTRVCGFSSPETLQT